MQEIKSLSVVIPAYNEEKNLRKSIKTIYNFLNKKIAADFEILIVENGSTDRTAYIAEQLEKQYSSVRVYSLAKPSYGEAYRYGILQSNYDIVTIYPVDLAFSLNFIKNAFKLAKKYPIILGTRFHYKSKVDRPLIRILISKVHTSMVNLLFRTQYNDVDCLKAFRSNLGKNLIKHTHATGPFIEVELVYLIKKMEIDYLEIPVNHIEKEIARHPFYIIRSILKNFVELVKYKLTHFYI